MTTTQQPLFVVLGTVYGLIALHQILARGQTRGQKGLTLALLAFAAMWRCWALMRVWL